MAYVGLHIGESVPCTATSKRCAHTMKLQHHVHFFMRLGIPLSIAAQILCRTNHLGRRGRHHGTRGGAARLKSDGEIDRSTSNKVCVSDRDNYHDRSCCPNQGCDKTTRSLAMHLTPITPRDSVAFLVESVGERGKPKGCAVVCIAVICSLR
jgi:hypothetical protein